MTNDVTSKTVTLIIIRGMPGGGKSYLADALKVSLGADRVCVLDPDAVDVMSPAYAEHTKVLADQGVDAKFHLYRYLRSQAFEAILANKIIIWNQAFMNFDGLQTTIVRLADFAAEHDRKIRVMLVEVEIDIAIARARIESRRNQGGHDVPDDALAGFEARYKSFTNRGYPVVTVDGMGDIDQSVASVRSELGLLYAP